MTNIELGIRPFGFPSAPEMSVDFVVEEGFEPFINKINFIKFEEDLPKISDKQVTSIISRTAFKLLKSSVVHGFGNEWNRQTAIAAAKSFGFPTDHLPRHFSGKTELSKKLKNRQAEIAQATEQALEIKVTERIDNFRQLSSAIVWIEGQFQICTQFMKQFPDLSKSRKEQIKKRATACLIELINKFGEQPFDRPDLLKRITTSMALGKPVDIIAIHCPPFRHSNIGINVIPTAEDQLLHNSDGETVVVSQVDVLKEVDQTAKILRRNGVGCKITVAIVDIDEFVLGDQENNLDQFCQSFLEITSRAGIQVNIKRVSELTAVNDLEGSQTQNIWRIWNDLLHRTNKISTRLVDEEFQRLQRTSLPELMKTREFATQMAGRRFVVHFFIGKSIPRLFPHGIVMLRARGSEASEIDRLGAKSINERLLILNHWRERRVINPPVDLGE